MQAVFAKDPDERKDYAVDWSTRLPGDTITLSTWTAEPGITLDSPSLAGYVATAWLSGGTSGTSYLVTNRVTTSGGRVLEEAVLVRVASLVSAYPSVSYMRNLLPRDGEGFTDEMVQKAIDAAIAEVVVVTGDPLGREPLGVKAVEKYAHADLLEKLFPRDARSFLGKEEDSDANTLRVAGDRALAAFVKGLPAPVVVGEVMVMERAPWLPAEPA